MPTPSTPEPRATTREDRARTPVELPAETDQDIDTAGTEADEAPVGSALDQSAVERDPRLDTTDTRP